MTAKKKAAASRSRTSSRRTPTATTRIETSSDNSGASTAPRTPVDAPSADTTRAGRAARAGGPFNRKQRAKDDAGNDVARPSEGGPVLINGHHPACYFANPDYEAI